MPTGRPLRSLPLSLVALVLVAVTLAFAALGPANPGGARVGAGIDTAEARAAAKTVTVTIQNFRYSPATVTIKRGQKIRWVNRDDMRHNAYASKARGPRGPLLAKGKSWTWTARNAGTFSYSCTPHPYMKGKVVVR